MNNLNAKFENWGQSARRLPERHGELKASALDHLATQPSNAPNRVPARRLPWLSLAFAVLALIAFVVPNAVRRVPSLEKESLPAGRQGVGSVTLPQRDDTATFESQNLSLGSSAASRAMPSPTIYPYPVPENPPATDTREFLKTDYRATIRTRRVQDVGSRATTVIRGYGGRIDSSSLGESSGHLSFVLPATKLDAFRSELTTLVGTRFITEQTSTQNLLPEKRVIESEQENAGASVARLERERSSLIASFRRTETDMNARIAAAATDDELRALQDELTRARRTYESRKRNLDVRIQSERDRLAALEEQTSDLLDTVATVRGTVSLYKISLYGILNTYLYGHAATTILLFIALAAYARHRRAPLFPVDTK